MAEGFDGQLVRYANTVREWATKRAFEDEGWRVQASDDDTSYKGFMPLTLERYKRGPGGPNDSQFYVERHGEVWNVKYNQLGWITQSFTQFGQSNLAALGGLLESVRKVPSVLCAKDEWTKPTDALNQDFGVGITGSPLLLENGLNELDHWNGLAASVFKNAFGSEGEKWEQILNRDFQLADLLVAAIEAQLAVTIATRKSILTIGKKTIAALGLKDDGDFKNSTALFVLGAIATVVLTVATLGVGATVVGAAFTVTGALAAEAESDGDVKVGGVKPSGPPIDGDTAAAILNSMSAAISQLITDTLTAQSQIATALNRAYNSVLTDRDRFELTIFNGQSGFSGTTEANADSERYLGSRIVQTSLKDLETAATESFPQAAKPLATANSLLDALSITDAAFYSDFSPVANAVKAPWTNVRDLLQDIVGNNGRKVTDAGRALLWSAKQYGAVDDGNASQIGKTYDRQDLEGSGRHHQPVTTTSSPLDKKLADR